MDPGKQKWSWEGSLFGLWQSWEAWSKIIPPKFQRAKANKISKWKALFWPPSSTGKFLERNSGVTSSRNSCDPFRFVGAPELCSHSLPLSPGCRCHYIHQGGAHNHGIMYSSLRWGRFRAGVCLLCCIILPWPNSWHLVEHKRRNKWMFKPSHVPAVFRHSSRGRCLRSAQHRPSSGKAMFTPTNTFQTNH